MKTKKGKLYLDKRDTRVGNFVVTEEENHYKVQDINSAMNFRFRKETLIGQMMGLMLKKENEKFLTAWISAMYSAFVIVPDVQFITDVINAVNACVERHREELYGSKDVTDGEDKKILAEQKELHEGYEAAAKDAAQSSSSE